MSYAILVVIAYFLFGGFSKYKPRKRKPKYKKGKPTRRKTKKAKKYTIKRNNKRSKAVKIPWSVRRIMYKKGML